MTEKITLTINDRTVTVNQGTTVYEALKSVGVDVPIFCYQDRMPPFGACRMCLVEVEKMAKLQASCTLIATDGMVVKTESKKAVDGRKGILELLLINHPLDCPICDKGGECPLQENALQHGPGKSEFFEEKRKFTKAKPLGPVLMLDRERCIVCARCTRFGDLIAGDQALQMIDRGYKTEVGTKDLASCESKFIGNTIQICPVGALTSQVYRFRARPWDNHSVNSSCTLCSLGCSMIFDSRDGEIMRTRSLENKDVNDIWLCDKGFFGYQFVSHQDRLKKPLIRKNGILEESTYEEAFKLILENLKEAIKSSKIAGFGGNPLTTEENYLFQKLFRQVFKSNHLDHRIQYLNHGNSKNYDKKMEISIGDTENLSYAILLGVDLTEEFPVIWLRLRQAINRGAKVIYMGHYLTEISSYMTKNIIHVPGLERETLKTHLDEILSLSKDANKGAIFVGSQYLETLDQKEIISDLNQIKEKMPNVSLNFLHADGNSLGAEIAGMDPHYGPLYRREEKSGLDASKVLEEASRSGWDFIYVAGSDPSSKFPRKLFSEARSKLKFLLVQDLFLTETALKADVVLPTLCYAEKGGSFINIEGRIQKLLPGKEIPEGLLSDGEIFIEIAKRFDQDLAIDGEFLENLTKKFFQINPKNEFSEMIFNPDKTSYVENSLRVSFTKKLFDHGVRMQKNEDLVKLSKSPMFSISQNEGNKRGLKNGDEVILSLDGQQIQGKVELSQKIQDETLLIPLGFKELNVQDLGKCLYNGLRVQMEKV